MTEVDAAPADARPRPDAIEPVFDTPSFDATDPPDTGAPVSCADWCSLRLAECGDPPELARELCNARCMMASMPNAAISCLRSMGCVEIRAAVSRNTEICGLEPAGDSGVRIDTGVDVRTDTGVDVRTDSGVDVRTDAAVDAAVDARTDTGVDARADTGVDARTDTGVVVDARTDTGVDARTDTGVDARTDTGVDARTGGG
jgi:hypothetical protein